MTPSRRARAAAGFGLSVGTVLGAGGPAQAADFTVTSLADSGPGTLREAILVADNGGGNDRILFRSGLSGTITVENQLPDIDEPLRIIGPGPGRMTISGDLGARIMYVGPTNGIDVTVSGLTLTKGNSSGGAIRADGADLTVSNSVLTGNEVPNPGGAIAAIGGTLTINSSRITNNEAYTYGGGLLLQDGVETTIVGSTISGNTARRGGGIDTDSPTHVISSTVSGNDATQSVGGGIFTGDSGLIVENSTVTGNDAATNGGGVGGFQSDILLLSSTVAGNRAVGGYPGGGLSVAGGGAATLSNVIVADNTAPSSPDVFEGVGSSVDASFSLVEAPGATAISAGSNLTGVDPKLGPLANNGGPTATRALLPGSPALDKGKATVSDQRGAPRPFNLRGIPGSIAAGANSADIGAYERVLCGRVAVNRVGTAGPDRLRGTGRADGILGLGGRDRLLGLAGNDALCGGAGRDLLKGGKGRDKLLGQAGRDRLIGGPGRDGLIGGPGRDRLRR